jgi:predicted DNA-binding transcriptional regulator AlpA
MGTTMSDIQSLDDPACDRLLTTREVLAMIGVKSPTTLRRLVRERGFPAPVQVMEGRNSYRLSEVQQWINTCTVSVGSTPESSTA